MIKQSVFMILLYCLAGNWAMAQDGPLQRGHHPVAPKPEMTEEMKSALNLTTEQRAQLDALQAETKEAMQVLKQEGESVRTAMRELQEANQTKMEGILTDDQLVALRSLRQAEHERRRALIDQIDHEALREEMRNYQQAQIEPLVLAQRQKLETVLSAEDKATLTAIRSQLEAARAPHNPEKEASPESRKDRHRPPTKGQRSGHPGQGPPLNEIFPEQHKALVAMVAKYDEQISNLLEELEPQKEQWAVDQAAIRAKYIPQELREEKHHPKASEEDHQARAEKRELGAKSDSYRIHFLLLDVNAERD